MACPAPQGVGTSAGRPEGGSWNRLQFPPASSYTQWMKVLAVVGDLSWGLSHKPNMESRGLAHSTGAGLQRRACQESQEEAVYFV